MAIKQQPFLHPMGIPKKNRRVTEVVVWPISQFPTCTIILKPGTYVNTLVNTVSDTIVGMSYFIHKTDLP